VELEKIMKLQGKFDAKHSGLSDWSVKVTEENLELLEFLMIGMMGEFGEFANTIKKIIRGDFSLSSKREEIEEEVADIFIYLVKICNQMDIDLAGNFLKKLEKNKKRFKTSRK